MDALNLNADCWVEVLKKVESEDLFSLSNVCELFRQITSETYYGFSEGNWKFDACLPLLIPYMGSCYQASKSALTFRLVSKSWQNSVERTLEEGDLCPTLRFKKSEEICDFLERFGDSNPSPILLRRVFLNEDYDYEEEDEDENDILNFIHEDGSEDEDDLEEGDESEDEDDDDEEDESDDEVEEDNVPYYTRALEFAQRFGMKVWNLEMYRQPPEFLQILPHFQNLKTLRVGESGEAVFKQNENGQWFIPWVEHPLPCLPHLRTYTAVSETIPGNSLPIFFSLEKYGPQLEHLSLYNSGLNNLHYWSPEGRRGFFQNFRALKTLALSIEMHALNIFDSLPFLDCPLESLTIHLSTANFDFEEPFQFDTFLRNIRHLQLLRNLHIRLWYIYFSSSGLQLEEYSNPNITHLEITFAYDSDQNKMSLNFLNAFTQLHHLTCNFHLNYSKDKVIQLGLQTSADFLDGISIKDFFNNRQIHKYFMYEAYHSNIWDTTTLTKLTLTLSAYVFDYKKMALDFSREECNIYRSIRIN